MGVYRYEMDGWMGMGGKREESWELVRRGEGR